MADAKDLDGLFADSAEQHPVIAGAQAELRTWRLELDHAAGARFQIAVDSLENLPGILAIDTAQIGPRRRRPDYDPFSHRPSRS